MDTDNSNWYVTAPASPHSYAQKRVYDGPLDEEAAEKMASEMGERYEATREGPLALMKIADRR